MPFPCRRRRCQKRLSGPRRFRPELPNELRQYAANRSIDRNDVAMGHQEKGRSKLLKKS